MFFHIVGIFYVFLLLANMFFKPCLIARKCASVACQLFSCTNVGMFDCAQRLGRGSDCRKL